MNTSESGQKRPLRRHSKKRRGLCCASQAPSVFSAGGRMERATETRGSTLDQIGFHREPEWRSLLAHRGNVLVEATGTLTEAFLAKLKPSLREPVQWSRPGAPLELRSDQHGVLILQDVA